MAQRNRSSNSRSDRLEGDFSTGEIEILFIDVDPQVPTEFKKSVQGSEVDFQAIEFGGSSEVLEYLNTTSKTIGGIVSDLPRQSGFELLREIRILHPSSPYFFLTSEFDKETVREALDRGAADCLISDSRTAPELGEWIADRVRCFQKIRKAKFDESRFRMPLGTFSLDSDRRISSVSYTVEQLFSRPRSDLLGRNVMTVFPSTDDGSIESLFSTAEKSGQAFVCDAYINEVENSFDIYAFRDDGGITVYLREVACLNDDSNIEDAVTKKLNSILDVSPFPMVVIDGDQTVRQWNEAATKFFGWKGDEVIGNRNPLNFISEGDRYHKLRNRIISGESVEGFEIYVQTKDGGLIQCDLHAHPTASVGTQDKDDEIVYLFTDVSMEERFSASLRECRNAIKSMSEMGSTEEILEAASDTISELLEAEYLAAFKYDGDEHALLQVMHATPEGGEETQAQELDTSRFVVEEAYERGDLVYRPESNGDGATFFPSSTIETELILPLGEEGVIIVGAEREAAFSEPSRELAYLFAVETSVIIRHIEDREEIARLTRSAEDRMTLLDQANRMREDLWTVQELMMESESAEAFRSSLCTELVDSRSYGFVGFARHDTQSGDASFLTKHGHLREMKPSKASPDEMGWLRSTIKAVDRTGEMQVVRADREYSNTSGEDATTPIWAEGSIGVVPVAYETNLYGILVVHAPSDDFFQEEERTHLRHLGRLSGFAQYRFERLSTTSSDRRIELELRTSDSEFVLNAISQRIDSDVSVEHIMFLPDGTTPVYATFSEDRPDQIQDLIAQIPTIENITRIEREDEQTLYEILVADGRFIEALRDHNVGFHSLSVTDGVAECTLDIASDNDDQELIRSIQSVCRDVEVVERTEKSVPLLTRQEFLKILQDQLTERQYEALLRAYASGFFDWPRKRTGEEIATSMDIAQPTFHRHLRTAESRSLETLFDDFVASFSSNQAGTRDT